MTAYGGGIALKAMQDYLSGAAVKAMLVKSTYTQDPDHALLTDIPSSAEISGGSYVAGGQAVTGLTVSYDATSNQVRVDCDDITFAGLVATDIGGVIFYRSTGTPSTSVLLCFDRYASPAAVDNDTLTHQVSPTGFLTVDLAA